jgi:hypothetical protein
MRNVPSRQMASRIAGLFALCTLASCDAPHAVSPPKLPTTPALAKGSGISVTAANPSFGDQGQANERVTITGSGFDATSQASWLRNGIVDTTITIVSTHFVSPTTLVATINISPKSPVDYRDIQVVSYVGGGRTQGIGSLLFEVTQAVQVPGTSWVRSINDNGEATGTLSSGDGVFYYDRSAARLDTVSLTGTGYDISPAGNAIVGSGGAGGGQPYLYTRTSAGGAWVGTALPMGATSTSGVARAMRVDGTGQVVQIAGLEYGGPVAVTWLWQATTASWQRLVLPPGSGTEVRHHAISDNGVLGGTGSVGRTLAPAVWVPNGTGGYTYTLLSTANGAVNGVRSDGGLIVGFTSTAVYWLAQPGGTWSAPTSVSACGSVKDVADSGRFLMNGCSSAKSQPSGPAYADAPYSTFVRLGGLGPKNMPGTAAGISHGGHYAGGYATVNSQSVGVYWTLP